MFTCISQLWDWLEPQPFETTIMEGKKQYNVPQDSGRYSQFTAARPQEYYLSDAYQQQQQQQHLYKLMYDAEYAQDYITSGLNGRRREIDDGLMSSAEMTPTETQPYGQAHHNLYYDRILKEQIQQQENERLYQLNPRSVHQTTATTRLKHQYQQLQEEKMRMQIQTQNDALLQQQQTFALRQQLNPPVPLSYPQSPTSINSKLNMGLLEHQHKLPPTNLNLNSQYICSPEVKTDKMDYQGATSYQTLKDHERVAFKQNFLTQQQQQQHAKQQLQNLNLQSPQSHQVIIQQNHPSKVVNQAVQTQMSDASQKSSSSTSNTPQSPSHSILERRKSESLKSPIIKRMNGAPISLSGFLNKQGSDGLKVWKKRYFVLSEYCLFYYKSAEQDKLLGSVLLPSYSISPCTPEDKVYRKYAFKCEHTNMRTYILAADTEESMEKWMKYLTMAAVMQDSAENSTLSSNQSCSESLTQTYQSQQCKYGPLTTANEKQPLYINAPPKPSRKVGGDVGYCTPTSPNNRNQDIYDAPRTQVNFVETQALYGIRNETVTTNILKKDAQNQQRFSGFNKQHSIPYSMQEQQIIDRRTPDQYSPQEYTINKCNYEDIYGGKASKTFDEQSHNYRRPVSPQGRPSQQQLSPARVPMREKVSVQTVPRPHSADFLDYENRVQLMPYEQNRAPRPKSSLDINKALDHYYYSEASYAEQMRTESANYLPKQSYRGNSSYSQAPNAQQQQQESRAQKITKRALRQQEFLRSASARIPRKDDSPVKPDEGDKKREESMKRLLEWKQRMLQSPLTRKIASQTNTLPLESRHSASEELRKTNIHRTKSEIIKKDDSYNSYSSDDEDGARMARRSDKNHSLILHVDTSAQDNESHSPKKDHNVSIESFNNTNNSTISLSTPFQSYKPVYTQKTVVCSKSNMYTMQSPSVTTNNDLTDCNNQITNEIEVIVDEHFLGQTEIKNDVCDFDTDERNTLFEYTDADLNEVLLSSTPVLESGADSKNDSLTNIEENHNISSENHYMPMTPKKPSETIIVPLDILSSIKRSVETTEESAYIEMIKGSENQNDCKSTYEFINISSSTKKLEPLYMELTHNVKRNSLLKNILELPDILKEPIISNSTSSLNRLLTVEKNIKRLSLSDTFRPASYYLSTVNENNQKSISESNATHNENGRQRRQKNLSFDNRSTFTILSEESKNLNINQSISQLSLPDWNSPRLEQIKILQDNKTTVPVLETLSNSISSETTNSSFDECKQANDLSFFEVNYIKPPDGFTNICNEAPDMSSKSLCRKLSNTQLDCYYDSLEDVNQINETLGQSLEEIQVDLEKDFHFPRKIIHENLASCNITMTTNQPKLRSTAESTSISDIAPYYYSDIAQSSKMTDQHESHIAENLKLNNLKDVNIHRAGITHIHNIIYNKIQQNDETDKINGINIKNFRENDHNKLQKNIDKETERMLFSKTKNQNRFELNVSGDQLWEEDSLWCEHLRVQSHRHTKSLDELNRIDEEPYEKKISDKRQNSKLTRDVTYVNNEVLPIKQKHMDRKSNQSFNDEMELYSDEADDVYVQLAVTEDLYETLRETEETQKKLYSIDREKIRQWDLMSSGLQTEN